MIQLQTIGVQKTRFRSPLNSTAVLNLNCSLIFSFKSFYTCFLSDKKHQKRPAPAKSVITAFCSRVASDIPRPAVICRKQLFVQASGTKQLAFHAITASRICTAQTNFVLFPLLARLFAVILMVPVSFSLPLCAAKFVMQGLVNHNSIPAKAVLPL